MCQRLGNRETFNQNSPQLGRVQRAKASIPAIAMIQADLRQRCKNVSTGGRGRGSMQDIVFRLSVKLKPSRQRAACKRNGVLDELPGKDRVDALCLSSSVDWRFSLYSTLPPKTMYTCRGSVSWLCFRPGVPSERLRASAKRSFSGSGS